MSLRLEIFTRCLVLQIIAYQRLFRIKNIRQSSSSPSFENGVTLSELSVVETSQLARLLLD